MNRIRKYKNVFQVLITPTMPYNTSYELMMGGWDDDHLRNYYILTYNTLGDAQCQAFSMPDIDWNHMIVQYKDAYYDIKNKINDILKKNNYIVDFKAHYLTPIEAKETMFNRVMEHGKRFSIVENMNDIISYYITNPWTKNIVEISKLLISEPRLRIIRKVIDGYVIRLVGLTDLSMTYEIILRTSLLAQWQKWNAENPLISDETKKEAYYKMMEKQKQVDMGTVIR